MGAFPKMVQEIKSLKEEADHLSEQTVGYIRPEKKNEFRRRIRAITKLREAAFYVPAEQGAAIEALSGNVYSVIKLGRVAGTSGFSTMIPAWGHLVERCEALARKMEIFNFADEQSLKSHLWWMSLRGGATEMATLLQLKTALPSRYTELPVLIDFAIERINERLVNKVKSLCDFFGLREGNIIGSDPESAKIGLLSAEAARKIEVLDSLKTTMESQHKNPRAHWRQSLRPMLMRKRPVNVSTAPNQQVKRLVDQFLKIEDSTAEEETSSDTSVEETRGVEAYAVACIKDHEPGTSFSIGDAYILNAGVSSQVPEGFEGQGMNVLATEDVVEFEIVVHAEDMDINPGWRQPFTFKRDEDTPLLEFELTPRKAGDKTIRVDFLYRRHWLTTIRFEVNVRKRVQAMSMQA